MRISNFKFLILNQFLIFNFKTLLCLAIIIGSSFLFLPMVQATETLPDPPQIISRAQWGADESWRTNEAYWPEDEQGRPDPQAKIIVLHHTASANLQSDSDQSGRYAGMVRDIYRFHTKSKAWIDSNGQQQYGVGDICYNWLIDINGNVYEGRAGGNGIVGAHAAGFNTGSIGVAVIGTYGGSIQGKYLDHQITQRLKTRLIDFIAWVAVVNDIDLTQKIRFCDFEGENCRYTYPLVGHRDVGNTQCPGNSLYAMIPEIRQEAAKLAVQYKNYLYQVQGENPVYLISQGVKKPYESLNDFQKKIGAYTKLSYIPQTTAELFPLEVLIKYGDGDLVKEADSAIVYLLKQGERRPIASANLFNTYELDWSKINVLNTIEIAAFKLGSKLLYPEGTLLKGISEKVYLVDDEKIRHIASALVFDKHGFDWTKILNVAESELANHQLGENLFLPDASLVKLADSPLVYFIEQGQRRPIASADIFEERNLPWADILTLTKAELDLYKDAKPLLLPDDSLMKLADKPEVYVVKNEKRYWIQTWDLLKQIGLKTNRIIKVAADDLVNYVLGPVLASAADWQKINQGSDDKDQAVPPAQKQIAEAVSDDGSTAKTDTAGTADDTELTPETTSSVPIQGESPTDKSLSEETSEPSAETLSNLGPLMRVAITSLSAGQEFVITVLSDYDVYKNNQILETKKAGQLFSLTIPDCTVCAGKVNDLYEFVPKTSDSHPELDSGSSLAVIEITSYEARPNWNPSLNDNQFRGKIELRYSQVSGKWLVINELALEEYVWGVAEITNDQEFEYLKAMTIAARSYANYHLSRGGKRAGEPYILNNTANDQVYKGYGFEKRADVVKKAALATAGKVLMFAEKPAVAPYSSDTGGISKDACQVWGSTFCDSQYAYLRGGVKDPAATVHTVSTVNASHGVGLSAIGARQMATEGLTYDQILGKYYPGTEIDNL